MGMIRKAFRASTFAATGVPLAHKRSKKDKIVRNTAAIADELRHQNTTPPPSKAYTPTPLPTVPPPQPTPQGPPPGWYQDPHGSDGQRWWDGTAWTEHLQLS